MRSEGADRRGLSPRSNGGDTARVAALQRRILRRAAGALRVGIDLVDVESFRARFDAREELLASVFTADELAYCRGQRRPWVHLAVRFAAREAGVKALGTGLTGEMTFRDIAVLRDAAGAPALSLSGATAQVFSREGLTRTAVSLAHTRQQAIAVVLVFP